MSNNTIYEIFDIYTTVEIVMVKSPVRELVDRYVRKYKPKKLDAPWKAVKGTKVITIQLSDVIHMFDDKKVWEADKGNGSVSVWEVIRSPKNRNPKQWRRMERADTSYPIIISKRIDGKWDVIDGLHRLMKLYLNHKKSVKAQVLTPSMVKKRYFLE